VRHDRSSERKCVRQENARKNGEAVRRDCRSNVIDWNGCLLRAGQGNGWGFFHTNKYMDLEQLGDRLIRFAGGSSGVWRVLALRSVRGEALPHVERVAIYRGKEPLPFESRWTLSGVISNTRYVERPEQQELTLKQAPLGRLEATTAALIPIRKTAAWWNLTQEERPERFREQIASHRRRNTVFAVGRTPALS